MPPTRQAFQVSVTANCHRDNTVVLSMPQWSAVCSLLAQLVEVVASDDDITLEMRRRLADAGVTVTPIYPTPETTS